MAWVAVCSDGSGSCLYRLSWETQARTATMITAPNPITDAAAQSIALIWQSLRVHYVLTSGPPITDLLHWGIKLLVPASTSLHFVPELEAFKGASVGVPSNTFPGGLVCFVHVAAIFPWF